MVAGGITKELRIDSQIEQVETQIRAANEQLFGIVSKEAEDAATASSGAKSDAKEAKAESDAANRAADEARGKWAQSPNEPKKSTLIWRVPSIYCQVVPLLIGIPLLRS